MRKYFLLIMLTFIYMACKQKPAEQTAKKVAIPIKIDLLDTSAKYIEDIADSINTITLQTKKGFALSFISDLFVTEQNIIVANFTQRVVYIFDRAGVLTDSIAPTNAASKYKRGEFNSITDVFYREDADLIEILDLTANKVFRFDVKGNIKDTLIMADIKAFGYQFVSAKDDYISILSSGNIDRRALGAYKRDGKYLRYETQKLSIMPSLKYFNVYMPHALDVYKDSVYYFPMLEDKIFNATSAGIEPAYVLDYPAKYKLPSAIRDGQPKKDSYDIKDMLENASVIFENNSLFINDQWVSFRFSFQSRNQPRNVFFSKKQNKVVQYSKLKSKSGTDILPYASVLGKYKDFFITVSAAPQFSVKKSKSVSNGQYKIMFFRLKDI